MTKIQKVWLSILLSLIFINILLTLAPREYTRALRHKLVPLNMRIWAKGSLVHAWINAFLWQKGNGK